MPSKKRALNAEELEARKLAEKNAKAKAARAARKATRKGKR